MHIEASFEDVLCPFNLSLCHTMAKAHPTCVHTVYLEGEGSVSTYMYSQEVYFNSSVKKQSHHSFCKLKKKSSMVILSATK